MPRKKIESKSEEVKKTKNPKKASRGGCKTKKKS